VEAARRLQLHGPNQLPEGKSDSLFLIFLRQFKSPLIYVLLAVSVVTIILGEYTDSLVIFAVLLFNSAVGTFQEGKAQKILSSLKNFVTTNATVLRNGSEVIIPDSQVTVGDVIVLKEGYKIPSDARVLSENNLKVDESMLTGESHPVHKVGEVLSGSVDSISSQNNMLFKGTNVVAGDGLAVTTCIGEHTEIGKISLEITSINTEIPLKVEIKKLSEIIVVVALSVSGCLFLLGAVLGIPMEQMFIVSMSLLVSTVPEGLPVVVTITLANGVWRMGKKNALVKKLQAVEALGQADILALDKTGTITRNEMLVRLVYIGNRFYHVSGVGYSPVGKIIADGKTVNLSNVDLQLAAKIAAFCSNASAIFSKEKSIWQVSGDPTEAAMRVFAEKIGVIKSDVEDSHPRLLEIPFDYDSKYHASLHKLKNGPFLAVAGAPEELLNLSTSFWKNGGSTPLGSRERARLKNVFTELSQKGFRIVALAARYHPVDYQVGKLTFIGFLGITDALRDEVKEAIATAKEAGIKVAMITGDHKLTAETIAAEAGIFTPGDLIISGNDLAKVSSSNLREILQRVSVFSRVTPSDKLKIIKAYRSLGNIVAMTGDGVNDAPSLAAADLGVSMGRIGTDVAKEASDIVLLDDNLSSIVSAIEEGRGIYKTIKKVILYLFSTSLGEILTITAATLSGFPLILSGVQIIWLNFVTDGFLDVALSMKPNEKDPELLRGKHKNLTRNFLDRQLVSRMVLMAIPMMLGSLFVFKRYMGVDLLKAQTMVLTTLAAFQWFNAWNCRSARTSVFKLSPISNKALFVATFVVIFLQIAAVYTPFLQGILKTTPLNLMDWLLAIGVASSILFTEEIRKALAYLNSKRLKRL